MMCKGKQLKNEWEKVKDNEEQGKKVFWMESVEGEILDNTCHRMETESLDQLEDEDPEV